MANRSTFPNALDVFIELADLPASKYADAQELKALMATINKTSTQNTRMNTLLTELANYHMSVEKFNRLQDCIYNMEDVLLNRVLNYFQDRGVYDNTIKYDIFNVVTSTDGKEIYLLYHMDSSYVAGIDYTNTTYWRKLVSVKDVSDFAQTQGDYAKLEGDTLAQIITDFTYIGEYDSTIQYVPKNIVIYNGSTYINKTTCKNVLPTDTNYWRILASGFVYKDAYNGSVNYQLRDMVYYEIEKTIYFCIKPSQGNLPTNTTYWKPMLSVKSESLYATQQGDYAKTQGNNLSTIISQFTDLGNYDNSIDYKEKNIVQYNGSTYINKVACKGILPTDEIHWHVLATGYVMKGDYDSNKSYQKRDIVYYGIEKTLYECIQPAGLGISPYNTQYWKPIVNVKDMIAEINDYVNDTTSLYVAHDMGITITHNLGDYPIAKVINLGGLAYGLGSFGESGFGSNNKYQILSKSEYIDENTVKIYLNEYFDGTPTITPVSSTVYNVDFSNAFSLQIKLII